MGEDGAVCGAEVQVGPGAMVDGGADCGGDGADASGGSEMQRLLETMVIGGIISSTILTPLVLSSLYRVFGLNGDLKLDDFHVHPDIY